MTEATYDNIKSLIVDTKQHGGFLQFVFECPVSRKQVWSDNIRADDFVIAAKLAAKDRKDSWLKRTKFSIFQVIRNWFGYTPVAATAMRTANGAMNKVDDGSYKFTEAERVKAAVIGFRSVRKKFTWVDDGWQHVDA